MGNSQASGAKAATAEGADGGGMTSSFSATFGGSIKSRRGSKAKVFGLLGQKKQQREANTPTTPTAAADTPHVVATNEANTSNVASTTKTIGRVESIDEEAELHQQHDAVVRQLEFEQMEIRRKEVPRNQAQSQIFAKCKGSISDSKYRTENVPIHRKRPAPRPPTTSAKTTTPTPTHDTTCLSKTKHETENEIDNKQHDYNREFIEHLFDSTNTMQTLEANERREEERHVQPVLSVKTNRLDKNAETKQNEDNVIKTTTTPVGPTVAEHRTANSSTALFGKPSHRTNFAGSSKTFPMLAGNTTSEGEPSEQLLKPQSHQHQLHDIHERDTILRDSFCDNNNDFDDDFQNNQMATSLTMMMAMMGGNHPDYSFTNDNCDTVVRRDLSSSSDSLFTDPLTPPQSTTSVTAPLGSAAGPCSTTEEIDEDDEDDDAEANIDDKETAKRHKQNRNQTHITTAFCTAETAPELPTTLKELTATTTTTPATRITGNQRPLSDISITSGDTSGILSPTTARAILELQKRHQADKLSLLSIAKTTYLELLPTAVASSPELETDSPDEQMALHLGKKLAQVLSGGSASSSANVPANIGSTAGDAGSPALDSLTCCNVITGNELFNISKAKKIELPSLSSRLVATASPMPTPLETPASTAAHGLASTDAKHLPSLPSPALPAYSASASTNSTPSATTETQSTVIISFKSSQTPVQSQPPFTIAEACEQQPELATGPSSTAANSDDTMTETMAHTPSFSLANSSHAATTVQMGSPICTPRTPKNNVLKKVASFTIEKSAGGGANNKVNNGDSNAGAPGQQENITSKRSTFVPEKLSFAAYEKFEGQMLMKWLISSLQNNCNQLSEQDITCLTLQYCNNLISVGVLKQISEKNGLETFKPFQMYQWTHSEAPTTSQPHTPGKLDKVTSWPYCSTPTSGISRIPKAIQLETPQTEKESGFLQVLRKKLLTCASLAEVQVVVNDMLPVGEQFRRPSKRCIPFRDLINCSDKAESGVQEAAVQTDHQLWQALSEFVCGKCKNTINNLERQNISRFDKEVQVFLNGENTEKYEKNQKVSQLSPPVPPKAPPPPPPPPISAPLLPPPPPPPLPCIGGAAPVQQQSAPPASASTLTTSTVPPPPPPGVPKTCSTTMPAPLPNPAEGGWFNQANTLRKTAVNPPKPMKPLYWTRIVTQPPPAKPAKPFPQTSSASGDATDSSTPSTSPDEPIASESPSGPKQIWQEIDETNLDNIDEFTELFSREAVVPKALPKIKTQVRARPIKVLDSKRSQNVGIFLRSSHVDFYEIEHAIYHVDTSVVSLETLQQINKNKATTEELERIKDQGDTPLDEPEQFLLKISQISLFTERISCMVFMAEFEETATIIERKLEVVMQLSQFLMESEELKLIFAIILTLGNYMNGGNRQRGQADGFTLEILSKLKDVKSKDSQTTLLHFIVRTYIGRKRKEGVQLLEIPLPIPEPSDVERATQVDFDEVKGQITKLSDQLKAKRRTTDKVIMHSTDDNMEPFKSKMDEFIKNASKEIDKLLKELDDCRDVFIETMKFYQYAPKSGTLEQCTPNKFFEHWTNFTNDFKDIMKKEIALLWNELLKKSKDVQTRKTVKTTKVKPGGLKERIMRLNKK